MFLESRIPIQPRSIEKSCLSFTVWPHEGSTFKKKKVTRNSHFPRPAETDPYCVGVATAEVWNDRFDPICWQNVFYRCLTRLEKTAMEQSSWPMTGPGMHRYIF